jgi:hypothetical protein
MNCLTTVKADKNLLFSRIKSDNVLIIFGFSSQNKGFFVVVQISSAVIRSYLWLKSLIRFLKQCAWTFDAAEVDLHDNLMYIERMEKKSTSIFVIGAKPPQTLSPKAKKQLSSAKPSKKAHMLAENAARVLAGRSSFSFDKAATTPAQTAKKKSASVK